MGFPSASTTTESFSARTVRLGEEIDSEAAFCSAESGFVYAVINAGLNRPPNWRLSQRPQQEDLSKLAGRPGRDHHTRSYSLPATAPSSTNRLELHTTSKTSSAGQPAHSGPPLRLPCYALADFNLGPAICLPPPTVDTYRATRASCAGTWPPTPQSIRNSPDTPGLCEFRLPSSTWCKRTTRCVGRKRPHQSMLCYYWVNAWRN